MTLKQWFTKKQVTYSLITVQKSFNTITAFDTIAKYEIYNQHIRLFIYCILQTNYFNCKPIWTQKYTTQTQTHFVIDTKYVLNFYLLKQFQIISIVVNCIITKCNIIKLKNDCINEYIIE